MVADKIQTRNPAVDRQVLNLKPFVPMPLTTYQESWITFIKQAGYRTGLFCKQGSGKTAVLLKAMMQRPDLRWHIFLRKAHFKTWQDEIPKWTGAIALDNWEPDVFSRGSGEPFCFLHSVDSHEKWGKFPANIGVVIDESYYSKGYTCARYRALLGVCDNANAVLLANGDPVVVSVMDLWSQMRLVIGKGHLTATDMRNNYFVRDLRGFGMAELPEASKLYRTHPAVVKHSIWYHPPSNKKVRHVTVRLPMVSPKAKSMYAEIKKDLETTVGDHNIQYKHAMEKMIRLHQICGGTIPLVMNDKPYLAEFHTAKLWWLKKFLSTYKGNLVVWCAYRHEVKRLCSVFPDSVGYMGGQKIDKLPRLVFATQDMGVSTNIFSQFPVAVYYSANYKFFLRSQSRYRIDRADSKHDSVTYYYLVIKETIDEYIHSTLKQRGTTLQELFNVKKFLN
jgi:hypothetical protein